MGTRGAAVLLGLSGHLRQVRDGDLGVPVLDYADENVSDKVVRIVQGYVAVVNKMVWRKG